LKKIIAVLVIFNVILLSCGCTHEKLETDDVTTKEEKSLPEMDFGYANIDGTMLIVLYDHEVDDNKSLNHFEYAIGANGRSFEIEYSHYQERDEVNDNGRQTMFNFENQAGCIYDVKDAAAIPNDTYMLLTKEEYDRSVIFQVAGEPEILPASDDLLVKCSELAERKTKNGWKLTEYQNGIKVSMIEFESIDRDLLVWMVFEDGDTFWYHEFPAVLSDDGQTGWRLEDFGNLHDEDFNVFSILCCVQSDQKTTVYLNWWGSEGEIVVAVEFFENGTSTNKTVAGRYMVGV